MEYSGENKSQYHITCNDFRILKFENSKWLPFFIHDFGGKRYITLLHF